MLYTADMSIRILAILALTVLPSAVAFAIPLVRPLSGAAQPCNESSYDRGLRDLIHKVGVIGVDGRAPIEDLTRRGEISSEEELLLKQVTGSIHCPFQETQPDGTVRARSVVSSAFLVGDGGPSRVLSTVAHAFYWPNQDKLLPDVSKCYFLNRAGQRFSVDITNDLLSGAEPNRGQFVAGTTAPTRNRNRDRIVVRLKKPPGARQWPLRNSIMIDASRDSVEPEQKLINISAPQRDLVKAGKMNLANDLMGQVCKVRKVTSSTDVGVTPAIITDCSSDGGASGSALLSRGADGRLRAVGLVTEDVVPGRPRATNEFDEIDNHTVAVGIDSQYRDEINTVSRASRTAVAAVSN